MQYILGCILEVTGIVEQIPMICLLSTIHFARTIFERVSGSLENSTAENHYYKQHDAYVFWILQMDGFGCVVS